MSNLIGVLIISLLIDRIFGEPPEKFHSTVWMGRCIKALKKNRDSKAQGILIFLIIAFGFSGVAYILMRSVPSFILAAAILKLQFSWKALEEHARVAAKFIENNELENARTAVSKIVSRDTKQLGEKHLISATIESAAESCVDSIISPIFYYLAAGSIFDLPAGIAAAVFYRAANTLDSMVGYKGYATGFFSAKADDVLNFIPARITAALIIFSAFLTKKDWRNGIRIFLRDRKNTASPNSGQAMAVMAGVLRVQLEKINYHKLGDKFNELSVAHISECLNIVNLSAVIFIALAILKFY